MENNNSDKNYSVLQTKTNALEAEMATNLAKISTQSLE